MTTEHNKNYSIESLTVLVIDDSKTSSFLVRQQLRKLGLAFDNVDITQNYKDAIKKTMKRFYDVIIMDYHLEEELTGSELGTLLYRKNLIPKETSLILMSGDPCEEVILTSLTEHTSHFIAKPIQTTTLGSKVRHAHSDNKNVQKAKMLIVEKNAAKSWELTHALLNIIEDSFVPIQVESAILHHLALNEDFETIELVAEHSQTIEHSTKVCARARLLIQKGRKNQAASLLTEHLKFNPLTPEANDILAKLFHSESQYKEALNYALRSYELTPSISDRTLMAIECAAKSNSHETLLQIGRKFAYSLSIIDECWLYTVDTYVKAVLNLKVPPNAENFEKINVRKMSSFLSIVNSRVATDQKVEITSLSKLIMSERNLLSGDFAYAHKLLLTALTPFYGQLNELPGILALRAINISLKLGECWITDAIIKSKKPSEHDKGEVAYKDALEQSNLLKMHSTQLNYLNKIKKLNTESKINHYQAYLDKFPLAIEPQLELLHLKASIQNKERKKYVLKLASKRLLPQNWYDWLKQHKVTNEKLPTAITSNY